MDDVNGVMPVHEANKDQKRIELCRCKDLQRDSCG